MRTRVPIARLVVGSLLLGASVTSAGGQTPTVERQPPDADSTTSLHPPSEPTIMRLRAGVGAEGRIRFFNVTNPTSPDQLRHALQAVRMLASAAIADPPPRAPRNSAPAIAPAARDVVVDVTITSPRR